MALQKETEKKLSTVFQYLKRNGADNVAQLITEIIRAECRTKRSTHFDLYDYADKTGRRHMEGIYYNDGKQVVSDGHQLLVLNEKYDEDLEGKIIDKNGEECAGVYPKYMMVLPETLDDYEPTEIDIEKFYSWIDERRAAYQVDNFGKKTKWSDEWYVKIGHCLFKASRFHLLIKAAKELESLTLYTKDSEQGAVVKSDKGIFMSMPWRTTDSDDVLDLNIKSETEKAEEK